MSAKNDKIKISVVLLNVNYHRGIHGRLQQLVLVGVEHVRIMACWTWQSGHNS